MPSQAHHQPPAGFRCIDDREVLEHVHAGRTVRARRQKLQFNHERDPLAVRRLVPLQSEPHAKVLLVHGLAQNRRTWRQRQRSFEAGLVEQGYEVFNLDLRGHGDSRRAGSRPAGSVDDYIEDLSRVLPLFGGPVYAVGHSLGAGVLLRAAIEGLRFAGIIHYAGVYTFAQENWFLQSVAAVTDIASRVLPRSLGLTMAPAGKIIAMSPLLSDAVNRHVPISGWARRSMEGGLLADRVVNGFDAVGLGIWMDMSRWARSGGLDPERRLGAVDTPLLILSGARDRLATPADALRCFQASGSADKRLHVFDEATHGYAPGHIDIILGERAPEVVWPVVFEWLDRRTRE